MRVAARGLEGLIGLDAIAAARGDGDARLGAIAATRNDARLSNGHPISIGFGRIGAIGAARAEVDASCASSSRRRPCGWGIRGLEGLIGFGAIAATRGDGDGDGDGSTRLRPRATTRGSAVGA